MRHPTLDEIDVVFIGIVVGSYLAGFLAEASVAELVMNARLESWI